MVQQWRCPTCGATNVGEVTRCRICKLLVPPAAVPPSPAAPPSSPPPVTAPPPPFPPRDFGPAAYPPPPPGWYPGAPVPVARRHRTGLIVACVVVPVLALVALGVLFMRGTDPQAAADRDAAKLALVTTNDAGGAFTEVAHREFARSRGGLRVEGGPAECAGANAAFEEHGQAVVDSVLQAQNAFGVQVIAEEIAITDAPDNATPMVDAIAGTVRGCLSATLAQQASTVALSLAPAEAPTVGDRAAAFHGSMGASGSAVVAEVDVVIVQQGRAVVLLAAIDTSGNLHGRRLEDMLDAALVRLAPRFGA